MEIKDYITKNLTNLNWNILPQIFEENDVELTEEIEAYLRNTPENTNWNVFGSLGGNEQDERAIIWNHTFNTTDSGYGYSIDTVSDDLIPDDDILSIRINGIIYENVIKHTTSNNYYYGADDPTFSDYPFVLFIQSLPDGKSISLYTPQSGSYVVDIIN